MLSHLFFLNLLTTFCFLFFGSFYNLHLIKAFYLVGYILFSVVNITLLQCLRYIINLKHTFGFSTFYLSSPFSHDTIMLYLKLISIRVTNYLVTVSFITETASLLINFFYFIVISVSGYTILLKKFLLFLKYSFEKFLSHLP